MKVYDNTENVLMKKAKKIVLTTLVCLTAIFGLFGFSSCDTKTDLISSSSGESLSSNGESSENENNPDHQHDYSKRTIAPTCTEIGFTMYLCVCGDNYVSDYVNATGHTEVIDKAVTPTCTETGLTEGKHCEVCSTVLVKQETIKAVLFS